MSLDLLLGKKTPKPTAPLCFCCLTRGWAGGGASLCVGHHCRQLPSGLDGRRRPVWQISDQNKRQQKISPPPGVQRPWRRAHHGFNRTHERHWVRNRALRGVVGPTLPTYNRCCSYRYMTNLCRVWRFVLTTKPWVWRLLSEDPTHSPTNHHYLSGLGLAPCLTLMENGLLGKHNFWSLIWFLWAHSFLFFFLAVLLGTFSSL